MGSCDHRPTAPNTKWTHCAVPPKHSHRDRDSRRVLLGSSPSHHTSSQGEDRQLALWLSQKQQLPLWQEAVDSVAAVVVVAVAAAGVVPYCCHCYL